jgi:hypothetical protein
MSQQVHVVDSIALSHAIAAVREGTSTWVVARHAYLDKSRVDIYIYIYIKRAFFSFQLIGVVEKPFIS